MKTELLQALFADQVLLMHEPDIHAMVAAMQSDANISSEPTNTKALTEGPRYTQIDVTGPIIMRDSVMGRMFGGCATELLMEQIRMADAIGAPTIFKFATGGGQPGFIGEAADMIKSMSVDTYGYAADQCCSAGFWLYSQCNHKLAHKSAMLGSIGVKLTSMSQEDPSKVIVSQFAPNKLPSDKKMQRIVNDYEACFIGATASGYGISAEDVVKNFGAGDVFMGAKAEKLGMCSKLTTLDQITRNMKTESEIRSEAVMDYLDGGGLSAMDEPENKKGVAGDGTGGEARRIITALRRDDGNKRGWTISEIASAIERSEGTTSAIANGEIENPPKQVIDRLKRMQGRTKPNKADTSMSAENEDLREKYRAELLAEQAKDKAEADRKDQLAAAEALTRKNTITEYAEANNRVSASAKFFGEGEFAAMETDTALSVLAALPEDEKKPSGLAADLKNPANQSGLQTAHQDTDDGEIDMSSVVTYMVPDIMKQHGVSETEAQAMAEKDMAMAMSVTG